MATEHEKQTMQSEIARVQNIIAMAINEIEIEGGSIRFFNAALLSAAMVLHTQVEGSETLDAAMTKHAKALLVKSRGAGSC